MKVLALALLLSSCAHRPSVKELVNSGELSLQSVSDLARSSYLRGCVESRSDHKFEDCVEKAKKHENEIKDILK